MEQIILKLIRLYQKTQPFHIKLVERILGVSSTCRFSPTCSEYTIKAIQKYGAQKGVWMGFKRFLRCNPWSKGGFDPVK